MDLLNPKGFFKENYIYQIKQTIAAYSDSLIAVGEALQNSIDAVCDENIDIKEGKIELEVDFDKNMIRVKDNGPGFPPDLQLLFLGGSKKKQLFTKGKIGVGIKVTLFSSDFFQIRSNTTNDKQWKLQIEDASNFESLKSLKIPDELPIDKKPLKHRGTEVKYAFVSEKKGDNYLDKFIDEMYTVCFPKGETTGYYKSIEKFDHNLPSKFAVMFWSFLKRFSYVGDVLSVVGSQENFPEKGIQLDVILKCENLEKRFPKNIVPLFEGKNEQEFTVSPKYLRVDETLEWVPKGKKAPKVFHDNLGRGGTAVQRTDGFNIKEYSTKEDFKNLLKNKKGKLPTNLTKYSNYLFKKINKILITIGRIPDFENFLPGGSRRIISCNGVVTSHNIDLTRGKNQEYVRCIDIIVDVDGELNYGKSQLTNMHLVKSVRDYVNDVYGRVLHKATSIWVGKLPTIEEQEEEDSYVPRKDLGVNSLIFIKEPQTENDVIALFFEIAGKTKLFNNFRVYGLSTVETYDCKAVIKRDCDNKDVFDPRDDAKLNTVEFKYNASEVIRDFDTDRKDSRDIDLVVAWDKGSYSSDAYGIYQIEESQAYKSSPKRVYPMVKEFIYDTRSGSEIQLLLLKNIVKDISS